MATTKQSEPLSFEKLWLMFQETNKKFIETDKKFSETDKRFQDTTKKLNKLEQLFTSQWGKLMESLVEGDLIKILNDKGIQVTSTASRVKGYYKERQFEIDLIAENGKEIVVVEVKTTLKPQDVKSFLAKLKQFKQLLPKYEQSNVIGAIAFLKSDAGAVTMAESSGLFVIRATGNSASIVNSSDFKPKIW